MEVSPLGFSTSSLPRQNPVPPTKGWLQGLSPGLCPNYTFMIHCALLFICIKLILLTGEVSGVSKRLMMLIPADGINTLCGRHFCTSACCTCILKNIFFQKNISVLAISTRFCKLRNELCQIVLLFFSLPGLFAM